MGKQGPCCHCGISTTPLWRNGPSDKPVLCNACGSRWRTKGTLVNYMPMHLGGCGTKSESGELKLDRGKKGSYNSKEQRSHKRKEPCNGHAEFDYGFEKSDLYFFKGFEEDASTRSSTGSGISYSEGCVQRSGGVAKSFSVYWPLWDCPVPSKKRTPLYRHRLSQAKLAGMLSAMYDCGSSELVHPSEEDLLVEYKPSSMAAEIGLGGMFIRQSMLAEKEQESEASSLIFENKNDGHLDAFSHESPRVANSTVQFLEGSRKHVSVRGKENVKQVPKYVDAGRNSYDRSCILNKALLENFPYIKRDVLQSCQSPLVFVELKDIVNFDTFVGLLTDQEQLQLLKYVSSADFSTIPESLRSMFNSAQFESALANFQLLLSEGMFDSSDSGLNHRVLQHYENLFSLTDLTASGWMEQCSKIANRNKRRGPIEYVKAIKNKESLREKLKGSSVTEVAVPSALKTFGEYKNLPTSSIGHAMDGAGEDMEIVGFIRNYSHPVQALACPPIFSDVSFGGDWQACDKRSKDKGSSSRDTVDSEEGDKSGPCFSANSFYGSSQENGSIGQCETIEAFVEVGTDHDILLDFPSSMSFPQAELLQKPSWNKSYSTKVQAVDGDLKPADSGSLVASNTLLADDLDWAGLLWNPATTGSGNFLPNGTIFSPRKMFL